MTKETVEVPFLVIPNGRKADARKLGGKPELVF